MVLNPPPLPPDEHLRAPAGRLLCVAGLVAPHPHFPQPHCRQVKQPELWATGLEHSVQTRIWLLINGLVAWYRAWRSWGLGWLGHGVLRGSVAMALPRK